MLVLDRKIDQGFWIGPRIFVKVLSISHRRVKIGIVAPDGITVLREELAKQAPPKRRSAEKS